jgi:thiol-disulfide isomerase/thioredoxin
MIRTLFRTPPIVALALCAALAGCSKPADYETLSGDSGRFSDLHGRWVFVNYWAEWCKPCIKEMPELKAFSDQYAQQAAVLTVNFDGPDRARLAEQVKKLNVQVPVLVADPAALLGIEKPLGLPSTYVFDAQGKFVTKLEGEQTVASLAAVMAQAPAQP